MSASPSLSRPVPARPSLRVSIADRAGKSFPSQASMHGYARWKAGKVSVDHLSSRAVRAKVGGQRTYDVRLHVDGGSLLVACSCPDHSTEVPGCKHVWATLLEIDRQGALEELRASTAALSVALLPSPTSELPAITPAKKRGSATADDEEAKKVKPSSKAPAKKSKTAQKAGDRTAKVDVKSKPRARPRAGRP